VNRRDALLLALIVAAAAALRLPLVLHEGIWRDEASTYYDGATSTLQAALAMVARIEQAPPAYFLLERAWMHVAGAGEVALKLPSLLFGIALIVALYALGRAAASRGAGLFAAAFACIAQPAIDLSAQARPYALAGLLAALALTAFALALRAPRPRTALVWFAALGTLLVYTHYMGCALLVLLACATVYVLWRRAALGRLPGFAAAFAAIALLYAPWLPTMIVHFQTGAPFKPKTTAATFVDAVNNGFGNLLPLASRHGQLGIAFAVGAVVWIVLLCARRRRGAPPGAVTALGICAVGGAVLAALLSLQEPRYVFPFAPAAYAWLGALAAAFCARVLRAAPWQRAAAAVVTVALLALFAGSERAARALPSPVLSGIRALAPRALVEAANPHTLLLLVPDYLGPTFGYYVGRFVAQPLHGFARWDDPQIFATRRYGAIWADPAALSGAEAKIGAAMTQPGARLFLVRDTILIDRGAMRYTRANALLDWIRARYVRVASGEYPGSEEDVASEEFVPRAAAASRSR
jgi:4-amino-4-deoxy-L-arabinose transferase-like glycosyltransferase